MKGFVLKSHEAQALAAGKPVVIWRPVKEVVTPIEELGDEEYDGPQQFFVEGGKLRTPARWGSHEVSAPLPLGVPLFGKETWYESGHSFQTYPEDDDWAGWSPRGYKSLEHIRYALDGLPPIRGANDWNLTEPHSPKFIPDQGKDYWRKQPSVHMPQWASRITLILSDVKVRRPCDVTEEEEAIAMGIPPAVEPPNLHHFIADGWEWCPHLTEFRGIIEDANKDGWNLYHFTALATPTPKNS